MKMPQSVSIENVIHGIENTNPSLFAQAQQHLDLLTKPVGSLGRLEAVAAQMQAIHSGHTGVPLKKGAYVFAADHGVVKEGVSAFPKEVTAQMVINFLSGGAAINVLSRTHNVELYVVDVGVDNDFAGAPGLIHRKVARSSRNMVEEAAMTRTEMDAAMAVGFDMADHAKARGQQVIATGEMGIGNTTPASAIAAILTGNSVASVTGMGTGLNTEATQHKVKTIEKAIAKHFGSGAASANPLDIMRCVGGLELAAITGLVLGAARNKIAVVVDGFISTAAVAIAYAVCPKVKDYLFAAHCSAEPGHRILLDYLGLDPLLSLNMRLGEGTGSVLAMPLIESAMRIYYEMATFAAAGVSKAEE